jgi:hypothetical protein
VPDGVTSTPGGDMDSAMDQSGKRVIEFFRDQLRIGRELAEQTGAPQLIIGGGTERNEESTVSPGPSDPLWMEKATAEAGHLAEGRRMDISAG